MSEFIKKAIHPIVNKDKNDKVQDRFVFNGTILEVGGNIAVESIEQIGYIGTTEAVVKFSIDNAWSHPPVQTNMLLAKNVTSVNPSIETPSVITVSNPKPEYGDNVMFAYSNNIYWNIKGVCYRSGADYIVASVDGTPVVDIENIYNKETGMVTEFKPFFTEEQYQELLDLIA